MTTTRELLQEILDDLEMEIYHVPIKKLRAHLAKPEPVPVAWALINSDSECEQIEWGEMPFEDDCFVPLFTKAQL